MARLIDERTEEEEKKKVDNENEEVSQITETEPVNRRLPHLKMTSPTSTKEKALLILYGCTKKLKSY